MEANNVNESTMISFVLKFRVFVVISMCVISQMSFGQGKAVVRFSESESSANEPLTGLIKHFVMIQASEISKDETIRVSVAKTEDGTAPARDWSIVGPTIFSFSQTTSLTQFIAIEVRADNQIGQDVIAILQLTVHHPKDSISKFYHTITIKDLSQQKTRSEKKVDELLLKLDENDKDTVGIIRLHSFQVPAYKKSPWVRNTKKWTQTKASVEISHINITVRNGFMLDIQVISKSNKVYTNMSAPIELSRFNERCDLLQLSSGENEYIRACDFILLERYYAYAPENVRFALNTSNPIKYLLRGTGINQAFDFKIFTDLTAVFANKPNGLTQIEAFGKILVNNGNIGRSRFIPAHYVKLNFGFSKFDTKNAYRKIEEGRQAILQSSWASFELGGNVISTWLKKKTTNWVYLDAGIGSNASRAIRTDSTGGVSKYDSIDVILPYVFAEAVFEFRSSRNMAIYFLPRFSWQAANGLPEEMSEYHRIIRHQILAFWHPKNSPGNRIFIRASYYRDIDDDKNPFFQLQAGYSVLLGDLVNKPVK